MGSRNSEKYLKCLPHTKDLENYLGYFSVDSHSHCTNQWEHFILVENKEENILKQRQKKIWPRIKESSPHTICVCVYVCVCKYMYIHIYICVYKYIYSMPPKFSTVLHFGCTVGS